MEKIQEEKQAIRRHIKRLKAELSSEEKAERSVNIFSSLEQDEDFKKAQSVLVYWSMNDEVNTRAFVQKWASDKKIYLPVVVGESLVLKQFTGMENMKKEERFGIYEPQGEAFEDWQSIEYGIIPGVAFDAEGNRLGRGKAFYDRILNRLTAKKVGVCFGFQMQASIPIESTDVPMDLVISEG